MNNRRSFIKIGMVAVGGLAISKSVFAAQKVSHKTSGLIYTKNDSGKWSEKVASHAPNIEIDSNNITLTTEHPMTDRHYIVRHTLVNKDGEVVGSKTFYPDDPKAESTYELREGAKGKFYATSFCNKHDFWITEFEI